MNGVRFTQGRLALTAAHLAANNAARPSKPHAADRYRTSGLLYLWRELRGQQELTRRGSRNLAETLSAAIRRLCPALH